MPSTLKKSDRLQDDEAYFGGYRVVCSGDVYGLKGNKMTPQDNRKGYLQLSLNIGGERKMYTIHRIVATLFVPNPCGYTEVNHIDGNKMNNHFTNLEWCTRSYNCKHAFDILGRKLSDKQKNSIRNNGFRNQHIATQSRKKQVGMYIGGSLVQSFESGREASRLLGFDETYISKLCRSKQIVNGKQFLYL